MAAPDAEEPPLFTIENDADVVKAADILFNILEPMFPGPREMISVILTVAIAVYIEYRKDQTTGVDGLLEHMQQIWEKLNSVKIVKGPLH